ncbi:MAG TPA: outer membrane lipoprotein LolB [Usitatibacter sp.]|nr:outer membrane lipoprotein LolB [Usitatibacter sp.]
MKTGILGAGVALALLLAACATAPRAPLPDLQGVPRAFEVTGRISIRTPERSDIAKLRWTRRAGSDTWVIASPLGNEVARLESGPKGTHLERAGQPTMSATNFQELTENILGVPLDPDRVAAWLHGKAASDSAGDWKVSVDETQQAGAVELARRITATRGDVVVRLVIDEYHPLE